MTYGLQIQLIHGTGGDGFTKLHTYSEANGYVSYELDDDMLVVYFETSKAAGVCSKSFPLHNVICVEEFVVDPGSAE